MRVAMHVHPFIGPALQPRNLLPDFVVQNSAPPPGIESRPAAISRAMVSFTVSPETSAMQLISGAEKQCKCTCGYFALIELNMFS